MDDLDSYLVERGIKLSSEQKNKIVAWLSTNAWKSLQSVPRNKYYGLFMKKIRVLLVILCTTVDIRTYPKS